MRKSESHALTSEGIRNSLQRNEVPQFLCSHCDLLHHIMFYFKLRKVKLKHIKNKSGKKNFMNFY